MCARRNVTICRSPRSCILGNDGSPVQQYGNSNGIFFTYSVEYFPGPLALYKVLIFPGRDKTRLIVLRWYR